MTPSISPLSDASKTHKDSADPTKDQAGAFTNGEQNHDELGSPGPSERTGRDRSSSLSDIEGSFGEQEQEDVGSDDVSTPGADVEVDSEAETERIKPTPQKGGNPARMSLNAPLKAVQEDALSEVDSMRASEDRELTRPPAGKFGDCIMPDVHADACQALAGRKRKRTLLTQDSEAVQTDESDSEEALMKRRGTRKSGSFSEVKLEKNGLDTPNDLQDIAVVDTDNAPTPEALSPVKPFKHGRLPGKSHKKKPAPRTEESIEVTKEATGEVEEDVDNDSDVQKPEECECDLLCLRVKADKFSGSSRESGWRISWLYQRQSYEEN